MNSEFGDLSDGTFTPLDTQEEILGKRKVDPTLAYIRVAYPNMPSWVLDEKAGGYSPEGFLSLPDQEKRDLHLGIQRWDFDSWEE